MVCLFVVCVSLCRHTALTHDDYRHDVADDAQDAERRNNKRRSSSKPPTAGDRL